MFVDYFLDNIVALNKLAKSYRIKIMMHSCGSIKQNNYPIADWGWGKYFGSDTSNCI